MAPLEAVDTETLLSGRSDWIGADLLEALAEHPLACIESEFPHAGRAVDSLEGFERPQEQHPVFYGCFDWHSAVHSNWCLLRQLRLFDDHPAEPDIVRSVEERLMAENVEREVEQLEDDTRIGRPYGWAWFLRLAAELSLWEDARAESWQGLLHPLEERIVELVEADVLSRDRPVRVGTHGNSAFALQCVLDYARVTANAKLQATALETSKRLYLADRDYPVEYEPLGWDFLSPALVEADLLRRVLDRDEFITWLDKFLPDVTSSPYDAILEPVEVDPDGGIDLHLVGLNLSRAWCLAEIAAALRDQPLGEVLEQSAARHAERGLRQAFTDEYAGAHWLSSFVVYLLTRNEGGIAPR